MSRELIDYDPETGISTWFEAVESEKKFRVHHTQDVSGILEQNKVRYNDVERKRRGIKQEFMHYAHIPDIVVMQWMKEGINIFDKNDIPKVKQKLRDPEWRHLRTADGRI
jgi:hypothetical protein